MTDNLMNSRSAPQWLTQWEYAHRGLHSPFLPENSIGAARAAMEAGLGIECDIQRSRDDQPMVFHDWQLERLTDAAGLTEVHSAGDLEALVLSESEDRMPRLEALLQQVEGAVPLLIEIKSRPDYDVERTCTSVAKQLDGYSGDHAVMSFDPRVGKWLAENSPDTVRGLVCTDADDLDFAGRWRGPGALETAQPDFLAVDIRDLPGAIFQLWRDSGRPLLSWTVRNLEQRAVGKAHADALICEGEGLA